MAAKISAPAVSRYLSTVGVVVTPAAAPLSKAGVRVNRSASTGHVIVQAILGVGLQRQEERLSSLVTDVLRDGGYTVTRNGLDSSILYVSREA